MSQTLMKKIWQAPVMKPNFALSLSADGICLLHRAAGGWRRVGEVPVSSEALGDDLTDLREAAARIDSAPLRTKLILPDDQIKYISVDTGDVDTEARRKAAHAALDGATPYAVDALVFDICAEGATTHIAAAARETLAEAEAFASEHAFHPVCFVAAPHEQGFLGEPWFGEAAHARALLEAGQSVEADGVRVVIIGDVPDQDAPEQAPTPPDVEDDPEPKANQLRFNPVADDETETDDEDNDEDGLTGPTLGFASRRSGTAIPMALGGVTRDASDLGTPQPTVSHTAGKAPLVPPAAVADSLRAKPARSDDAEDDGPKIVKASFLSRRRAAPQAVAVSAPAVDAEARRMTIFGARDGQGGNRSRFLGLILTAILIVFMAGVAALASVYLDEHIAKLFQRDRTLASTLPDDAEAALAQDVGATTHVEPEQDTRDAIAVASLNADLADGLSEEDAAVLDALRDPLPAPQAPEELDAAALEARYAVTGIWSKAPDVPIAPAVIPLEDFYLTSIDPISPALDAVALPQMASLRTDETLPDVSNPAAAGTNFSRDADGFIIPTPEGTLSPDGYTVVLGPPPLKPPQTPTRAAEEPRNAERDSALAALRPQARPTDLVEQNERATLGGLLRTELATYRPRLRPPAPQELVAEPAPDPEVVPEEAEPDPAPAAIVTLPQAEPTLRPSTRPRNFDRTVARIQRRQERAEPSTEGGARVASVAPRTVTPSLPSSASVTREATVRNAINLRSVNLIGVYGTPSDRRALVRLGNGRYKKVQVGDRFDGGRVSAIGDSELRYQKGGRNVVLKMPAG